MAAAAAVVAVEETQAPAPSAPAMPAMPHVVAPAPLKLDWSGDLTQIETDRAKIQAAQSLAPPAEPPRKPRLRPVLPPPSAEPLVQVETQRGQSATSPSL
jgi:ribonuclease E